MLVKWFWTGLLSLSFFGAQQVLAQDMSPTPTVDPSLAALSEGAQNTPSMELLEFLGAWETEDGNWIDPEEVSQMHLPEEGNGNHE